MLLRLIFPHPIICHLNDDHPLRVRLKRRHYFEQFDFVNMWQHGMGGGTAAYQELIAQQSSQRGGDTKRKILLTENTFVRKYGGGQQEEAGGDH